MPIDAVTGIEHLRAARATLTSRSVDSPRERLHMASQHFWSALFNLPEWPETLQADAQELMVVLFSDGVMEQTIRRMDDEAVARTIVRMTSLVDAAERIEQSG